MKGRCPTKAERRRMDLIVRSGCIVCALDTGLYSPAEIHHIDGKTKPDAHFRTIALCAPHHRHKSNSGEWVSRHGNGRKAFEAAYGSETELLNATNDKGV